MFFGEKIFCRFSATLKILSILYLPSCLFPSIVEAVQGNSSRPQIINSFLDQSEFASSDGYVELDPVYVHPVQNSFKREEINVEPREIIIQKELDRVEAKIKFSGGYRRDELVWNIAGDTSGGNPNILSELTWDEMNIALVKVEGEILLDEKYILEGYVDYGWILGGDNQDSDYSGDNRSSEFSRSNNRTEDDHVFDTSIGLGYQFKVTDGLFKTFVASEDRGDLWVSFLGGYSYHEQNLRITDGFQTIPANGSFDGLNSTYESEWDGPWLGFSIKNENDNYLGYFRFEYHWADYYAEANWNLRSDFAHPVSFIHETEGNGVVLSGGVEYDFNSHWELGFDVTYQNWWTDSGLDRTFFANGNVIDTQLNEVKWKSFAVSLSGAYHF